MRPLAETMGFRPAIGGKAADALGAVVFGHACERHRWFPSEVLPYSCDGPTYAAASAAF